MEHKTKRKLEHENTILLGIFILVILLDMVSRRLPIRHGIANIGSWWSGRFGASEELIDTYLSANYLTGYLLWLIPVILVILGYVILRKKDFTFSKHFLASLIYVSIRPFVLYAIFLKDYFYWFNQTDGAVPATFDAMRAANSGLGDYVRFRWRVFIPGSYIPIIIFLIIGLVFFSIVANKYYKHGKAITHSDK